ncbi:MAG: UDP-N-acetylmuramoyl-L-alanyl-D-glutamate--2,6-diaminopimelate ligase, partial [Bacteroidetes bacterium]|nr:UDP-N-acetylmuramoyl-L-alanyl-D-glutamate--2,6-diaminopimelate ligase [Bacteroidota bacterium]
MKEMILSSLLNNVKVSKIFQTVYGKMVTTHDVIISSIQYDSRKVKRGDMFVAIRGQAYDGHKFIQDAIHNGAKAVVLENDNALPDSFFMHTGVIKIVVSNTRKALAEISANYFNHPSSQLTIVGVTGTNGKTTTTHIIKSILEEYEK